MDHCPKCKSRLNIVKSSFEGLPVNHDDLCGNNLHIEVLLDNIRSIYNVGSVIRTSDGARIHTLHLCGITPPPDHPKVAKTSLGAEQKIDWQYYPNSIDAIKKLKSEGYTILALEGGPDAKNIYSFDNRISVTQKILIVIGNEVSGIDPDILLLSDHIVQIPMLGIKESLNVASAYAIAAYYFRFQFTPGNG
jgi:tRNA G18 (ribose-2'-O)-methylase SpoU